MKMPGRILIWLIFVGSCYWSIPVAATDKPIPDEYEEEEDSWITLNKNKGNYNVIKLEPILLFCYLINDIPGYIRGTYERNIGKKGSLSFSGEYGKYRMASTSSINTLGEAYNLEGFGIMNEIRFYPSTKEYPAPFGGFIGLHFRYRYLYETYTDFSANPVDISTYGHSIKLGFHLGYKVIINRFGAEFVAGYGLAYNLWNKPNDRDAINHIYRYNRLDNIRFNFAVTYTFFKLIKKKNSQKRKNSQKKKNPPPCPRL